MDYKGVFPFLLLISLMMRLADSGQIQQWGRCGKSKSGRRIEERNWDCSNPNKIRCSLKIKDCFSCDPNKEEQTWHGSRTYYKDGTAVADGGFNAWDCRSKCESQATASKNTTVKINPKCQVVEGIQKRICLILN